MNQNVKNVKIMVFVREAMVKIILRRGIGGKIKKVINIFIANILHKIVLKKINVKKDIRGLCVQNVIIKKDTIQILIKNVLNVQKNPT